MRADWYVREREVQMPLNTPETAQQPSLKQGHKHSKISIVSLSKFSCITQEIFHYFIMVRYI